MAYINRGDGGKGKGGRGKGEGKGGEGRWGMVYIDRGGRGKGERAVGFKQNKIAPIAQMKENKDYPLFFSTTHHFLNLPPHTPSPALIDISQLHTNTPPPPSPPSTTKKMFFIIHVSLPTPPTSFNSFFPS